jgi:type I restriction enzyme S subunit
MKKDNNNWLVKSLSEVAEVMTGYPFDSKLFNEKDGFPVIRIRDIKPGQTSTYYNGEVLEDYVIKKGDYLIGMDGEFNLAEWKSEDALLNQRACKVVFNHKVIVPKFGFYFLPKKLKEIENSTAYVTVKHISHKQILNIQFPLPPLPIQKQIAEILEHADNAKQKRKEANKLTDEFLQSVFTEMFGDPVKNPKGWKLKKLGELGKLSRGKSKHRPRNAPFLLGGPYPLIQTGEIVNSSIYIRNYTQTYSEEGLKQSKIWPKGTLCISIAANIGFTAIMNFDACFPDSVVGFVPDKKVIIEYIHFYFGFIQKQLEENAPQAAQKNINLEILGNLIVPVPPLSLQQQFAEIVNKTEALKEKQKQSELELENLFQSLMQRAFKGELEIR